MTTPTIINHSIDVHLHDLRQLPLSPTPYTTFPIPTTSVATRYLRHHPITSDGVSVLTCPYYDCTFTSRIGLVGHLRIHLTEAGEYCQEH
ncbi:unnamed protein product [Schistocephalus solidus]|uniref:C2H2-type domain-containing protein n=1 Tax=Schistocephalus solidus TaxID=70667 RepID=A0A183SAU0_SCHSO|nr:unnamed protein product [Schistocephalus solidus]